MMIDRLTERLYKEKYPDGYIQHYLAMYAANSKGLSEVEFKAFNKMYNECEGHHHLRRAQ